MEHLSSNAKCDGNGSQECGQIFGDFCGIIKPLFSIFLYWVFLCNSFPILQVARELSFQIYATDSLTEPQVAHAVSEALSAESALFIGNSMAIRDADMYGRGWSGCSDRIADVTSKSELPCHMIRVAGNRGASGIDGLLSTAVGFAVGCNKQVSF